ncbi:MAG: hypothetical protein Q8P67_29095, partial [archaeon]|nr:hypothetical protein [archaeon]
MMFFSHSWQYHCFTSVDNGDEVAAILVFIKENENKKLALFNQSPFFLLFEFAIFIFCEILTSFIFLVLWKSCQVFDGH